MTYKQAYELGKKAKSEGITNMRSFIDAFWSDAQHLNHTALVFAEAGLRGFEMPYKVTGWRYGHIPSRGLSRNYADDRPENGVSVMAIDGGAKTVDMISALFISAGRPAVKVSGYLNTIHTGSDGEPLILDAVEIS